MGATLTAPTAEPSHWQVRRTPHDDAPDLDDLVADVDAFRRDVVFRRPALTSVRSIERFGDTERLWDDLLRRGIRAPAFRVVHAGETFSRAAVTRRAGIGNHDLDDVIAANNVVDDYRRGATVVLQGLHHTDPLLARVSNNLALALDHPVQINAYLSPANTHGLDLHFDFHDVFVVQLGGSKRWRVWEPLARTRDPIKGAAVIEPPRLDELGAPLLDVMLRRGDCLYLPRGFPHIAETVDEQSDHLTIGLVAVTWQRVLRHAIDAEVAAGRLAASLPVGLLDPGRLTPSAVDLSRLETWTATPVFRHWMAKEIWRRQPATRLRPRVIPPIAPLLAFTPGPLVWLTLIGDRCALGIGERVLTLPSEAHDFLSALLDAQEPISVDRLKGLDANSREVVMRRLCAEGVLAGGAS